KALTDLGDLSAKQVAGMHKYLDRALANAPKERAQFWKLDGSSPEAYARSVAPNRERLRKMLGVVDERVKPKLEALGGPREDRAWRIPGDGTAYRARWAVLPGIDAEGLLLDPTGKRERYLADVIVVPPAGVPPEDLAGIGQKAAWFGAQLAEQGCR